MHTPIVYTASPCPVNPPALQQARQGQGRQRTTCIVRSGTSRLRISGDFLEVMAYIRTFMNGIKGGTC